jgi:ferredoxin-NADP reductase
MANPIAWQLATVAAIRDETPTVRSFTLALPGWPGHRPGQHVDLRLTAEDGYSVERSYSIASEPERDGEVDISVERIADGEVSPFLHDVVVAGDRLEVRGPIGGYFVWEPSLGGPLLLVAGGSGVVPLMAMVRHRHRAGSHVRPASCPARATRRRSSIAASSTTSRRRTMGSRSSIRSPGRDRRAGRGTTAASTIACWPR